ncbi:hypothetical protein [Streptomyces sp. PSAA01]|uniref:hypothetical protein n=1 Tax=Streptomyces sp. PSAA01 TaxID=2912762 RepID=UPI001F3D4C13|nr:hypothetical protein [Streptomyces sp. PSAA01]MCG0284848.1 hypothetical protein [Streptomyces sp. PSAA01]
MVEAGGSPSSAAAVLVVGPLVAALRNGDVLLAAFGGDSEQVKAAAEACSTTYMMGFGAIVGLIGGKVA